MLIKTNNTKKTNVVGSSSSSRASWELFKEGVSGITRALVSILNKVDPKLGIIAYEKWKNKKSIT